jgi:hypothetical protein
LKIMVAPGRVELPTFGLGNRCSIHLSYGASLFSQHILHNLKATRKTWQQSTRMFA